MTPQDDRQDSAQEIQHQFARLQEEMQRVMAAQPASAAGAGNSPPASGEALDFRRVARELEALRHDADRLRAHIMQSPEDGTAAPTIAELRARTEDIARQCAEIGRRTEERTAELAKAAQSNRETLVDIALRLDTLSRRQPGRWLVPLAILLGAALIAAAVMLDEPGRIERLIDEISALVSPPTPHAEDRLTVPRVPEASPPEPTRTGP